MRKLAALVMPAGVIIAVLVANWAHRAWRGEVPGGLVGNVTLVVALLLAATAFGLPDEPRDWQPAIVYSLAASLTGTGVVALLRVLHPTLIPRFVLVFVACASSLAFLGSCLLSIRSRHRRGGRDRVLAVIDGEAGLQFRTDAESPFPQPERPFTLIDVLTRADCDSDGLLAAVADHNATLLVLGPRAQLDEDVVRQATQLHAAGLRIRTSAGFYEEWFGKLPVSEIDRLSLLTDVSSVHGPRFGHLKRLIDVAFGLVGLLCTLLVTPLVAVGNVAANRGPLIFSQERVGLGGRSFVIYKFRTMRAGTQDDLSSWTATDDPRITPFGRLLRRTHVDELPQSLNMLVGTLSLVGPRPEQPRYVEELEKKLPVYQMRHVVKPGLTGWAQVKFRYAASEADALEKLQYDLYYVRHQSLTMDARIVSRTVRRMLFARGH